MGWFYPSIPKGHRTSTSLIALNTGFKTSIVWKVSVLSGELESWVSSFGAFLNSPPPLSLTFKLLTLPALTVCFSSILLELPSQRLARGYFVCIILRLSSSLASLSFSSFDFSLFWPKRAFQEPKWSEFQAYSGVLLLSFPQCGFFFGFCRSYWLCLSSWCSLAEAGFLCSLSETLLRVAERSFSLI